jgi:hypothetical protein
MQEHAILLVCICALLVPQALAIDVIRVRTAPGRVHAVERNTQGPLDTKHETVPHVASSSLHQAKLMQKLGAKEVPVRFGVRCDQTAMGECRKSVRIHVSIFV